MAAITTGCEAVDANEPLTQTTELYAVGNLPVYDDENAEQAMSGCAVDRAGTCHTLVMDVKPTARTMPFSIVFYDRGSQASDTVAIDTLVFDESGLLVSPQRVMLEWPAKADVSREHEVRLLLSDLASTEGAATSRIVGWEN